MSAAVGSISPSSSTPRPLLATAAAADVRLFHLHLPQRVEPIYAAVASGAAAGDEPEERLAEVVGEERVEDGVDTAVHVRQTVGDHLGDGERHRRVVDRAEELQHEDHLTTAPERTYRRRITPTSGQRTLTKGRIAPAPIGRVHAKTALSP